MRLLNTVYVNDHGARVGFRKGTVRVERRNGTTAKIPINAIDGIVLTARGQVTSELMAECVHRNIRLAALTRSGRVRFTVGGPTSSNVYLRVAQYQTSSDRQRCAALASRFVAGKLQNCRRSLLRWTWDADNDLKPLFNDQRLVVEERLRSLPGVENGDRVRGIEGDGTRRYFRGLALHLGSLRLDMQFTGRTRRPPLDPVNALLGYVYGLVLAEIIDALETVGLDPQVGFLHATRPGRPSLALDLLEEFRPSVADRFVTRLITQRTIRPADFITTPGGACYLNDQARHAVLAAYEEYKSGEVHHILLDRHIPRSSLPITQATLLARHLRGDIPNYPPYLQAA